jgi:hypothetical protein
MRRRLQVVAQVLLIAASAVPFVVVVPDIVDAARRPTPAPHQR